MKHVQAILFGTVNMYDLRCFGCNTQVHEPFRITSADLTGNPDVGTGLAVFCEECLPNDEAMTTYGPIPLGKTAMLSHADEVSGITVLADGTRVYWTEGRFSGVVARMPNGSVLDFMPAFGMDAMEQSIWNREQLVEENADIHRPMTLKETREWEDARK